MEKVFFPLDEELGLLPGDLAPRQQEHLVHLACFMPFEKAAEMVGALLGVQTNEETARRLTEHMGACMEAAETATDGKLEPKYASFFNNDPCCSCFAPPFSLF